ncbi:MAG: right-handed parallel beta-helix repeat-containing protein, partial [Limisphaerales bacterium]
MKLRLVEWHLRVEITVRMRSTLALLLLLYCLPAGAAMRPLHEGVKRAVDESVARFVDGKKGDDASAGTRERPWRTIAHGVGQLSAGETLVLRGGVYHEHVRIGSQAPAEKPVTIRSASGEVAIIDGGLSEFYLDPAEAWEPLGKGEYRSRTAFPDLPVRKDGANLLGNFADSMVPLHGYRFDTDLRSDNHLFQKLEGPKVLRGSGLYCGPGVFLNPEDKRIHVRLAHTQQPSIGETNNYRGETDPRKLRLVIAGAGKSALELNQASHVVLQDLVVRGAREATINIEDCANITLDNVTSYGGKSAMRVESTSGLRCVNSAFRGIAAPWLWRWSLKYRSLEARIISASSWSPPARPNRDFEFVQCEFTDCVDGVFVGNVDGVEIHHCLLDNISDDGFFITCRTAYDGTTIGLSSFHHNRISRVSTAFAFGVGHGRQKTINETGDKQLGEEVQIFENVFDLRDPVLYQQPVSGPITTFGRVAGDHGSPAWEPIAFVRNTVRMRVAPWRSYYAAGWSKAMGKGTSRRIEWNVFLHDTGMPGELLPKEGAKFTARFNQYWSHELKAGGKEAFLKTFRSTDRYQETGWTTGDFYREYETGGGTTSKGTRVGRWGRLDLDGTDQKPRMIAPATDQFLYPTSFPSGPRIAMVLGYPAFDAPLMQYAFEKHGARVEVFEREWLPVNRY